MSVENQRVLETNRDSGRGGGAAQQTDWTGLVAKLLQLHHLNGTVHIAHPPNRCKASHFANILLSLFVITTGCSRHTNSSDGHNLSQVNTANIWNPNTKNLDEAALSAPDFVSLNHDVKNFYELLHKKDWKATYELRSKQFRKDFPVALYLSWAQKEGSRWELTDYEILSVTKYNTDAAALICKFIELPGPITSYATVDWHKEEDGVWRCDAAGPNGSIIFMSTKINSK